MNTAAFYRGMKTRRKGREAAAVKVGTQPKPVGFWMGYVCFECSESGEYHHMITKLHAERHGYKDVNEMVAAGVAKPYDTRGGGERDTTRIPTKSKSSI